MPPGMSCDCFLTCCRETTQISYISTETCVWCLFQPRFGRAESVLRDSWLLLQPSTYLPSASATWVPAFALWRSLWVVLAGESRWTSVQVHGRHSSLHGSESIKGCLPLRWWFISIHKWVCGLISCVIFKPVVVPIWLNLWSWISPTKDSCCRGLTTTLDNAKDAQPQPPRAGAGCLFVLYLPGAGSVSGRSSWACAFPRAHPGAELLEESWRWCWNPSCWQRRVWPGYLEGYRRKQLQGNTEHSGQCSVKINGTTTNPWILQGGKKQPQRTAPSQVVSAQLPEKTLGSKYLSKTSSTVPFASARAAAWELNLSSGF